MPGGAWTERVLRADSLEEAAKLAKARIEVAQRQFRQKTYKVPFRLVFWAVVVLHVCVAGAWVYAVVGLSHGDPGGILRPTSMG